MNWFEYNIVFHLFWTFIHFHYPWYHSRSLYKVFRYIIDHPVFLSAGWGCTLFLFIATVNKHIYCEITSYSNWKVHLRHSEINWNNDEDYDDVHTGTNAQVVLQPGITRMKFVVVYMTCSFIIQSFRTSSTCSSVSLR